MAQQTNITINGNSYYRIRRTIGHADIDGTRKPVYKYFYGINKKDAMRKYDEWRQNKDFDFSGTMFDTAAQYYVDNVLLVSDYAQSTIDLYAGAWNKHIKGNIKKPLCDLTTRDIQDFYNSLHVTKAVMKSVSKFMSGLFRWLAQNNYCHNLTSNVVVPKKRDNSKESGIVVWTDDELKQIQSGLGDNRIRFFVICAMYTGLRLSELKGLKYSDFKDDFIIIERQHHKGETKAPKWNSGRSVPMHDIVKAELERHREWHMKEMKRNKYKTDFVFTTSTGRLYEDANLHRALSRYYDRIGVPHKKLHAFRSTFCTNLCRNGVPIQVASKLLGHKSIEVTSKYYAAVSDAEKKQALDKLPDYGE